MIQIHQHSTIESQSNLMMMTNHHHSTHSQIHQHHQSNLSNHQTNTIHFQHHCSYVQQSKIQHPMIHYSPNHFQSKQNNSNHQPSYHYSTQSIHFHPMSMTNHFP